VNKISAIKLTIAIFVLLALAALLLSKHYADSIRDFGEDKIVNGELPTDIYPNLGAPCRMTATEYLHQRYSSRSRDFKWLKVQRDLRAFSSQIWLGKEKCADYDKAVWKNIDHRSR
jgi:hypothetical protein